MKKVLLLAIVNLAVVSYSKTIDESIAEGAAFLLSAQSGEGYWSDRHMPALTALPVWALAKIPEERASGVTKQLSSSPRSAHPPEGFALQEELSHVSVTRSFL